MMVHIDQQVEQSHIDQNQVEQSHIDHQSHIDQNQVDQMGQIDQGQAKDSVNQPQETLGDNEGDVTMVNEQVSNKEEDFSDDTAQMQEEEEEDEKITTPAIPSKSRSLRTTSVRKRLEIEVKMK